MGYFEIKIQLYEISVIFHRVENDCPLYDTSFVGLWKKCACPTVCQFSGLQY